MSKTLNQIAFENLIAQGIEVGSKVKLIAKAESRTGGWTNSWVDRMSKNIGKIGTVNYLSEYSTGGIQISFEETELFPGGYSYPAFCLELTSEPVKVKLNDEYSAEICPKEKIIKVGCQTISFSKVKQLYTQIKKAEKES